MDNEFWKVFDEIVNRGNIPYDSVVMPPEKYRLLVEYYKDSQASYLFQIGGLAVYVATSDKVTVEGRTVTIAHGKHPPTVLRNAFVWGYDDGIV